MSKAISVRFKARSPMINAPLFDAVLAYVKYMATGSVTLAHQLPIEQGANGLYYASGPILENVAPCASIPICASLRSSDIENVNYVVPNTVDGHVRWDPLRKRTCGNVLNYYEATQCTHVNYIAMVTNETEFKRLVHRITNLGKLHNKGYGEVLEPVFQSASSNGLVDNNRAPLRPIPVKDAKEYGVAKDSFVADAAYKLNYWDYANRTKCYVPDPKRSWTIDQIEDELL